MVSAFDVRPDTLIGELAIKLKELGLKEPAWAGFVKTGVHKERPPARRDWFYVRCAALLRTIFKDGPVGVSKLRSKYGGSHARNRKPHVFKKGSGKVIRTAIQQLESLGLVSKSAAKKKGRIITKAGQKLLNSTASEISKKQK